MKPIDIPNIRDCSDVLAGLEARHAEIGKLIERKFAEQLAIGAEPDDAPPVDPAEARVAALLGKPPAPVTGSKRERLGKLTLELSDLRRAGERISQEIYVARSQATRQESNGDISVLISAIEAHMADNMLRGRGPMAAATSAINSNRRFRG